MLVVTNLEDVLSKENMSLSPNPTDGIINISSKTSGIHEISIHDTRGTILQTVRLIPDNEMMAIDLRNLAPGMYIMRIQIDKVSVTRKILRK